MKYYISSKEHLEIVKLIGDPGVLLYMQYLRLAATDHPVITDGGVAVSLGWTERKARRYRGELTKYGFFKRNKVTLTDGTKMTTYHIGKESVAAVSNKNNNKDQP